MTGTSQREVEWVTYTVRPMGPCTMWAMLWWPRLLPADDFPTPVVYAFKIFKAPNGVNLKSSNLYKDLYIKWIQVEF